MAKVSTTPSINSVALATVGRVVGFASPRNSHTASELRNVTVIFADVVQSTKAVLALGPEEARRYLDRVIEFMLGGVRKFGGVVSAIQGDGLMAVFGTPAATEDHALRGSLAAIAIRDAFATFPKFPGVPETQVRIGVHSGGALTRCKDAGSGGALEAAGAVVHVAAKIERMCPPGSVAVSSATIELVRGYVRSRPIGVLTLTEETPPIEFEELLEVSPHYNLEHYFSRRPVSPLVGRDSELRVLTEALRSPASKSLIIGIIGEAGLGKSRLCFEARAVAVRASFRVAEIRGVGLNSATPFAPLSAFLADLLLLGEIELDVKLSEQLPELGLDAVETEAVSAIFGFTRLDGVWPKMSGDARKKATIDGAAKIIRAVASARPLLLVVEDLQDLDHETSTCLRRAAALIVDKRFCMIVTSRPEGAETLSRQCAETLVLHALSRQDARRLVQNELRGAELPSGNPSSHVIDTVLDRANGNPFMLVELLRGLASPDSGGVGSVPMSIEILIRARVDRLQAPAQRLLQCASVLGMRFSATNLRRIAGAEVEPFEPSLRELVHKQFLIADAGMSVEFVHQITRVACYEGIPRQARARLHRRVLAAADDHRLKLSKEALADHAYHAGELNKALDFLWEACRESNAHSAVRSIAELRRRSLQICEEIGAEADLRAVDFQLLTFDALQQLGAYQELVGQLERALEVALAGGTQRQVCHASGHLATTYWVLGRYDPAYAMAKRALSTAKESNDLPLASYAQFILGCIQFKRGEIEDAVRCERELSEQLNGRLEKARFGAVAVMSVMSRAFLCWFLTDLGRFDEAGQASATASSVAKAMQQPYSQLLSYNSEGYRLLRMGHVDDACEMLENAYRICKSGSFLALDNIVSGWFAAALFAAGREEDAGHIIQRAIELDLGRYCCVPSSYYIYDTYARLLARGGRREEALQAVEQAVRFVWATRDPLHYAYAIFTRGQVKQAVGVGSDSFRRDFRWALRRAHKLGMRPLEAKCERALHALA